MHVRLTGWKYSFPKGFLISRLSLCVTCTCVHALKPKTKKKKRIYDVSLVGAILRLLLIILSEINIYNAREK